MSRFRRVQSILQANHKSQVVRVYTKACSFRKCRDARMRREASPNLPMQLAPYGTLGVRLVVDVDVVVSGVLL